MIRHNLASTIFTCFVLLQSSLTFADFVKVNNADLTMNRELSIDAYNTLQYLKLAHYLPNKIDDDYSSKTLDAFLKVLDPNKVYFTKQDISDFEFVRFKFDNILKRGNAEPAFEIFKRYRKRLSQRTDLAIELIDEDFDFTLDEDLLIDRDQFTWALNEVEIKEKWRARIKNDVLNQLLSETPLEEIKVNLKSRYERQRDTMYQLKAEDVFELFMNAFVQVLEPHTQYFSDSASENFRISMSLSLEGIGAVLQTKEDYTVINRLVPGGPASKSKKLNPEDKIVGVGQDKDEIVNVIGWRLMDVVKLIRGKKGTTAFLQIQKHDDVPGSPPVVVELIRDVIQLEDRAAKLSNVEIKDGNDKKNFSVISIPSFYSNAHSLKDGEKLTSTSSDVERLIKEIDRDESQGLIIDLRSNGGGFLNEAIALTGLFISEGPVVQVVNSRRDRRVMEDDDASIAYDGPLIVLIDRYSASASEIFAAAMQDYGRAIVVGERSFGKGTVQQVAPLRQGNNVTHESKIKFTSSQFFRINGGSTQLKGVKPDITINAGLEDSEFGERSLDNALPWSETKSASYDSHKWNKGLVEYLTINHLKRSKQSPAFNYLRNNSELIELNKDIKLISLNMDKRMSLREDQEGIALAQLNDYRESIGLKAVTEETKKDNPLPDEDEHWNIVYHTEAAKILLDQLQFGLN